MRKLLRTLLRWLGYGVWKVDSNEVLNFENVLWLALKNDGHLTYLQVGANDGVFVDPMISFLARHKDSIRGVALEPLPHLHSRLKENLRRYQAILPIQRALHASSKQMTMYCIKPELEERYDPHLTGMASFFKEHLLRGTGLSEGDLMRTTVMCSTFTEIVSEFSLADINVLIVDTEGYDLEVLNMVNFETVRPTVIRFEHGFSSGLMTNDQLSETISQLNSLGYQVFVEEHDATAVLVSRLLRRTI